MLTKNIHRTKLLLPHYVKQRSPLLKTDEQAAFSRGGNETRCGLKPNSVCSRALNIKKNRKLFLHFAHFFLSRSPIWRCLIYFCRLVQLWQGPCLTCGIRLENLTRVGSAFLLIFPTFDFSFQITCCLWLLSSVFCLLLLLLVWLSWISLSRSSKRVT